MDPERLRNIEELYHLARERSPGDRSAFLAQACGGDAELLESVAALLDHDRSEARLDRPALQIAADILRVQQFTPGSQVGPYSILTRLGEGGMGDVYKARDTRLGRAVAIKTLRPEFSSRFQREAKAISALNHPHVCTLYDVGPDYLVMELVEGETLAARLQKGPLPIELVLRYGAQIADAVSAAHAQGITHRDIKPANIMLTKTGVKVLDFGLAKVRGGERPEQESRDTVTASQTVVGTPAYMAPEQLEGRVCDARTDIFAIGLVLYEMATAKRAFAGESKAALIAEIMRCEPDLSGLGPPHFRHIVERCLAKDRENRWQSARDLALELEYQGKAVAVTPPAKRRRRALTFAAFACLLAVAGAGTLYFLSGGPEPTVTPLTSYPGSEREPSISPDGSQVAFAWSREEDDNFDIYVKQIGPAEPLRLTSDPADDRMPVWSPDGKWIAFLRGTANGPKSVRIIPAFKGPERTLGTAANMSVLDWSPDGQWLVISRRPAPDKAIGLALMSVETGEPKQLTSPPGAQDDYAAKFAPDGRALAFLRHGDNLMLLPLDDSGQPQGPATPLASLKGRRLLGGLCWSPDGRDLIVVMPGNEGAALWRVPVNGGSSGERLSFTGEPAAGPSISRDGSRLVFQRRVHEENNIWSLELDEKGNAVGAAVRAFDSSKNEINPQFSPDGSRVAFESGRSGKDDIWVCKSTGNDCTPLTSFDTHAGSPVWSRDGTWIAFDVFHEQGEIYVVSSNGGRPRLLAQAAGLIPRWSRNGGSIYYRCGASARIVEMAREMYADVNVCRIPVGGGEVERFIRARAAVAEESPDGKWVYFSGDGGAGGTPLRRMPSTGGEAELVLPEVAGRNFVVLEKGIWYLTPSTREGSLIRYYDFARRSSRTVYRTARPVFAGMTVSPDQRRILFTQIDRPGTFDLMLVDHFR